MPIGNAGVDVTTAGTAVPLAATSRAFRAVTITARPGNEGVIAVGGATVSAAAGAESGAVLAAGETLTLVARDSGIDDLAQIFIDASTSGAGVSYMYGHA